MDWIPPLAGATGEEAMTNDSVPSSHADHMTRQERWVRRTLRAGLAASGALLVGGLLATLAGREAPVQGAPRFIDGLRQAAQGDGGALIRLGLLILMATPLVRVLALAVAWSLARGTWRLAAVALAVLLLLAASLVVGVG